MRREQILIQNTRKDEIQVSLRLVEYLRVKNTLYRLIETAQAQGAISVGSDAGR
jgi:hypothetical protein